ALTGDGRDFRLGDIKSFLAVGAGAHRRVDDDLRDFRNLVDVLVTMLLAQGGDDARLVFVQKLGIGLGSHGGILGSLLLAGLLLFFLNGFFEELHIGDVERAFTLDDGAVGVVL